LGEEITDYGSRRLSYIFVVLEPVYQATIDLNFRLLARAYFQYPRREILAERARLPLLKAEEKALIPLSKANERPTVSE
jgi:hypothetical protein